MGGVRKIIDGNPGIFRKNDVQRGHYILIKTNKYFENDGNINKRIYIYECRKSKQKRLWE